MKVINDIRLVLVLCLTIGLAPFVPEPHILGKIRWISGGAVGMQLMDWWDVVLHGFPFVLLFRVVFLKLKTWISSIRNKA